tara:strand:+ start:1417 stop:1812 length:396 start_codon:yes stop_codon:yes gene_type:complete
MWTEGIGITDYRNSLWLRDGELPPEIMEWFDNHYEYSGWYDAMKLTDNYDKPYCRMDYKGLTEWYEQFSVEKFFHDDMSNYDGSDELVSPFYTTPKGKLIKLNEYQMESYPNYKTRKQDKRYVAYIFEMHS